MGTVTLRWVEDHLVVGTDSNGHSIAIGKYPGKAGEWAGMKPSDLLLLAAASCAAYDVISILQKGREPLQDLKVYCSGEQEEQPPYTFTRIHLHYEASGAVRPERLERAVRLAEEKYCGVISTLRQGVPVSCDFEIRPAAGAHAGVEKEGT
jgi:putative redox protein